MEINIYKFGGASLATPELVKNIQSIIAEKEGALVIVLSAMAKTTNALEEVVNFAWDGDEDSAKKKLKEVEDFHRQMIKDLMGDNPPQQLLDQVNSFLTEAEWMINEDDKKAYDFFYDQIVPIGELLSSSIVSSYLNTQNMENLWVDARDILRSDDTFREAKIDMEWSSEATKANIMPALQVGEKVITQGFIASTDQNESTTLGREGSDFTASLMGFFLGAQSVTIWKDVDGLLNADPRLQDNTVLIKEISYYEVVEMAYYGAQVIHPKTLKPLYQADIPLYVKSFLNKKSPGTCIHKDRSQDDKLPPITVIKENQLLIKFITKDFSFFNEENLSEIYKAFAELNIKQNLTQVHAVSFDVVVDNKRHVPEKLKEKLASRFEIELFHNKNLRTIRHYVWAEVDQEFLNQEVALMSKTPTTIQILQ